MIVSLFDPDRVTPPPPRETTTEKLTTDELAVVLMFRGCGISYQRALNVLSEAAYGKVVAK